MARIIRKSESPASVARGAIIQLLAALLMCYWRGDCHRSTHLKKARMGEFVEGNKMTWVGQSLFLSSRPSIKYICIIISAGEGRTMHQYSRIRKCGLSSSFYGNLIIHDTLDALCCPLWSRDLQDP